MNRYFAALAIAAVLCLCPVHSDDNYVHSFTSFTFPPKVGAFERKKITFFNQEHSDVEVDYDNDPFTVHLSVYVYPASGIYAVPVPLKKHYEDCKAAVPRATPDAKLMEEKPYVLEKSGIKYDGYYALFSFRSKFVGDQEQDLLSQLILFQRGSYYVLFRISYAANDKANAEKQIDDFLQQLAWPPGDGSPPPA